MSDTTPTASTGRPSLFRQPKAVWAVAFACVIAFMGIGLVDPILPDLRQQLHASQSQVELLFTSYFLVTGVTMVISGWVSTRIGPRKTLLLGLALIVAFSAAAGASGTIGQIVGFRAGWGLGNALFIATALSTIVGAASGGFAGAIILYEAALGLGISFGPLLGGELGGISWRGPFFGVAALMGVAFVAITILLEKTPRPPRSERAAFSAPFKALGHRGLLTMALTALFYNFGFFTLLAYTPFPLHLGVHELGYVFTGWGVLLALSSVFVAPRLQARFGTLPTLLVVLALIAADLLAMGLLVTSQPALIAAVIAAGALLGVNNTLVTAGVMQVSSAPRPTASAAYSFVRFTGGGIAPYIAGKLGENLSPHIPFYVGAGAVVIGMITLMLGRAHLGDLDRSSGPESDSAPDDRHGDAPAPEPAEVEAPALAR